MTEHRTVTRETMQVAGAMLGTSFEMLALLKMILRAIEGGKIEDQTILRRNDEEIETEALSDKIRNLIARAEGASAQG